MDVTVRPKGKREAETWHLSDLLGRELGWIEQSQSGLFYIRPTERGLELLRATTRAVHRSLEEAMSAIEKNAHAVCRLVANDAANDR